MLDGRAVLCFCPTLSSTLFTSCRVQICPYQKAAVINRAIKTLPGCLQCHRKDTAVTKTKDVSTEFGRRVARPCLMCRRAAFFSLLRSQLWNCVVNMLRVTCSQHNVLFLVMTDLLCSFPLRAAKRLVIIVQQAFPRSHIKSADVALLASQQKERKATVN